MNIVEFCSIRNGLDFLKKREPQLLEEIVGIITSIDIEACRLHAVSGKVIYSPDKINDKFKRELLSAGWEKSLHKIAVRECDEAAFIKNKTVIEIQFGNYAYVAYDIFIKHLLYYYGSNIDAGIAILPVKSLQSLMDPGMSFYESEIINIYRQEEGLSLPPHVIIGVET